MDPWCPMLHHGRWMRIRTSGGGKPGSYGSLLRHYRVRVDATMQRAPSLGRNRRFQTACVSSAERRARQAEKQHRRASLTGEAQEACQALHPAWGRPCELTGPSVGRTAWVTPRTRSNELTRSPRAAAAGPSNRSSTSWTGSISREPSRTSPGPVSGRRWRISWRPPSRRSPLRSDRRSRRTIHQSLRQRWLSSLASRGWTTSCRTGTSGGADTGIILRLTILPCVPESDSGGELVWTSVRGNAVAAVLALRTCFAREREQGHHSDNMHRTTF